MGKTTKGKFTCDFCSEEKSGPKHKVFDENWNLQRGVYECDDCLGSRLSCDLQDEGEDSYFSIDRN